MHLCLMCVCACVFTSADVYKVWKATYNGQIVAVKVPHPPSNVILLILSLSLSLSSSLSLSHTHTLPYSIPSFNIHSLTSSLNSHLSEVE